MRSQHTARVCNALGLGVVCAVHRTPGVHRAACPVTPQHLSSLPDVQNVTNTFGDQGSQRPLVTPRCGGDCDGKTAPPAPPKLRRKAKASR